MNRSEGIAAEGPAHGSVHRCAAPVVVSGAGGTASAQLGQGLGGTTRSCEAWTSTVAIIPTQYHEPPPNARPHYLWIFGEDISQNHCHPQGPKSYSRR
jgi:hypothetical protein